MNKKSEQAHMPHAPMLLDNTTCYECHICILVNNKRGLTPKEINKSKYHAIMHCVCIYTKFYNILFSGLRGVAVTKKKSDWLTHCQIKNIESLAWRMKSFGNVRRPDRSIEKEAEIQLVWLEWIQMPSVWSAIVTKDLPESCGWYSWCCILLHSDQSVLSHQKWQTERNKIKRCTDF